MMQQAISLSFNYGLDILYVDSELNTESFTVRVMSYLTGLSVSSLKAGDFRHLSEEEQKLVPQKIDKALATMKKLKIRHCYRPDFSKDWLLSTCKKLIKEGQLSCLVFDYIKNSAVKGDDASSLYIGLSRMADFLKNTIATSLNIACIAGCQLNRDNQVADSYGLERSCSVLVYIIQKSNREMDRDGEDCGNTKFVIKANRLGSQMDPSEDYVDANLIGDKCIFMSCTQHLADSAF